MQLRKTIATTLFMATCFIPTANAEGEIQLDISGNNNLVLSIQLDGSFLQGTAALNGNISSLTIHGMVPNEASGGSGTPGCGVQCPNENEGGTGAPIYTLVTDWGEADVIVDCGLAFVSLYQSVDGQTLPVLETMVETTYCQQ